jgi:Domain of unknown function (DUF1844)
MSDPQTSEQTPSQGTQAELMSALFAQMVLQQSNLALMLMGKTPHPESGQTVRDIEGAKLFIDQLEMLEAKTKGNLSKEESTLLKQSLMSLRMAFVECVNSAPAPAQSGADGGAAASGPAPAREAAQAPAAPGASGGEEESRKKFTKKY